MSFSALSAVIVDVRSRSASKSSLLELQQLSGLQTLEDNSLASTVVSGWPSGGGAISLSKDWA